MDMQTARPTEIITVIDPDSKLPVDLQVYKCENGGMFAIDASAIEQLDIISIPSPFDPEVIIQLEE